MAIPHEPDDYKTHLPHKCKTKVSGCFRTENGAQNYLDVMSYLSTGKKHGVSVYEALTAAFNNNSDIVLG